MQESRDGSCLGLRSRSRGAAAVLATTLAFGLLAACGDDSAGEPRAGAGSAGVAGAGQGGASAGRGGRGGSGGQVIAEGGSAGDDETGEGGAGEAGRGPGAGGSSTGGAPPGAGGASGAAGESAAGAGGDGPEAGVLGVEGGRVSDAGGDITLSIPPGALLGNTEFGFAALTMLSSVPDGYDLLPGTLHEITWSGAGFAANATITVGIRAPETLLLQDTDVEADVLFAQVPPVSGVTVCQGSATNYDVEPGDDSYEGTVTPACRANAGTGGSSGGVTGGPGSRQVALSRPQVNRFPAFTQQPAGQWVGAGWDVSFSVTATGDAPLAYQWYRDGAAIPAATGSTYRLGPAAVRDHGALFTVSVTNRFGTLLSSAAQLQVSIPSAPTWGGQRAVLQDFGASIGAPQVGSLTWLNGFAAWNDGTKLEVAGSNYAPVEGLSLAARSAPLVLTIGGTGYVVFVDDDGTSTCTGSTGNRLRAVGISTHQNQTQVPNSAPFELYRSPGDCITAFSAGLVDPNPALLPDPIPHDSTILIVPLVYALTEAGGGGPPKVGVGGAGVATCGFCSDTTWEYAQSLPLSLPVQTACGGPAQLGSEGVMGRFQSHVDPRTQAQTTAVLTWVAGGNACAATLDDSAWSEGRALFDNVAPEFTPVAALDNAGNALVAASRVDSFSGAPSYQMATSYRSVASANWEFRALDLASAPVPVATAFTPSGDALLAWVNQWDGLSLLLATRRTRAGVWDDGMESLGDGVALGSGRPRLCVDRTGTALALFEQTKDPEIPIQIWGKLWFDGFWGSSSSLVQDNAYAGSDVSCVRHWQAAFTRVDAFQVTPGFVAWREVDLLNPSVSRIVAHGAAL